MATAPDVEVKTETPSAAPDDAEAELEEVKTETSEVKTETSEVAAASASSAGVAAASASDGTGRAVKRYCKGNKIPMTSRVVDERWRWQ